MKSKLIFSEEQAVETLSDAKIYNEMTSVIPPESMSVPLILHGILEQVEAQAGHATNRSLTSNPQDDVGRYLHEKLMSLSMGKDQQKVNSEYHMNMKCKFFSL